MNFLEPKLLNNLLQSAVQQQQQQQSISPQPFKLLQLQNQPQTGPTSKPTLITPTMFQVSANLEENRVQQNVAETTSIRPEPLTSNQLMQALSYLLENDPDFIRKIHEAYVKSFNKMITL